MTEEKDIRYLDINEKQSVSYCIPIWLRDEQVRLSTNRIKGRIEADHELKDDPIAIVCFGPSLNDTWEKIKDFKYIITCSGAHKFLLEKGIIPTWHVDLDPRPHKVQLLGQPHKDVEYLIASTCHPNMFDKLEGYNVKLWHIYATEKEAYRMLPPGEWAITGGGSVGLRAMSIARFFGFTNQHIFGMDGCEGKTGKHADFHPNQSKERFPTIYEGKIYYTIPGILEPAKQTFHELNQLKDVKATFYGDGLVQAMAKNYVPNYEENVILAMRKPILISEEYKNLNKELHETNLMYGIGGGDYAEQVLSLYDEINATSILDYGCGKGYLAKALPFPIWEYDPAIPGKDDQPRSADLVVCIDVLEHIEPDKLLPVLSDIQRCTKKLVYFVIDTILAQKTLSDGRNTHSIVKNLEWWKNTMDDYFFLGEPTMEGSRINICAIPKSYQTIKPVKVKNKNWEINIDFVNKLLPLSEKIIMPDFNEEEYYDFIGALNHEKFNKNCMIKGVTQYSDLLFNDKKYHRESISSFFSLILLSTIKNIKNTENKKLKLCDIGCGVGNVVYFANKIGYDAVGIEIQENLKSLHEKIGINIIYGDFFEIDLSFLKEMDIIYLYRPIHDYSLNNKLMTLIYENTKEDVIIIYIASHIITDERYLIIPLDKKEDVIYLKK